MKYKVLVALITPFDIDLQIDFYALGNIVDRLLEEGCDGFIVCGTTAEAPTLTRQEKIAVLDYVIARTRGRGQIWFGCGSNDTAETCAFVKAIEYRNIDGVLIVVPYYNKPSSSGVYAHFQAIAQCSDKPIMIYNVPSRTGIALTSETLCALAQDYEHIVALKQASHDLDIVADVQKVRPDFIVYSGEDGFLKEGIMAGMHGVISVMGHLTMPSLKQYFQQLEYGNTETNLDDEFKQLSNLLFKQASPAPLKYILSKKGMCQNIVRLPLTPIDNALACEIDDYISEL